MEPVVYDFAINERGTWADLRSGEKALLPAAYYALHVPGWLRADPQTLPPGRRAEIGRFSVACHTRPELAGMMSTLFDRLLPQSGTEAGRQQSLAELLDQNGFDRAQHQQISDDLKAGRIGLAQNRLPVNADIKDVKDEDVLDATTPLAKELREAGLAALARGELAIVTLAAGVGSRWTQGAGVVKALHPFCRLGGRIPHLHRNSPGQKPAHQPSGGQAVAAHCHHQLPDPSGHGRLSLPAEQLRLSRSGVAVARTFHRFAHDSHGARPAFSLGGNAAANAR